MLAAIAYLTGTPRYTSKGIIMLPPPRPIKEPIKPAGIEMRNMVIISITVIRSLSVTVFMMLISDGYSYISRFGSISEISSIKKIS